jgi:hypothetical protein
MSAPIDGEPGATSSSCSKESEVCGNRKIVTKKAMFQFLLIVCISLKDISSRIITINTQIDTKIHLYYYHNAIINI